MATSTEPKDYNENLQSQTTVHQSSEDLERLAERIDLNLPEFLDGMTTVSDDEGRFEVTELRRYLTIEYETNVRDKKLQKILSATTNFHNGLTGAYESQRDYDRWEYEIEI